MKKPFVSIILTCYNFENYICSSIESILNQTVNFDIELIIVDDASRDSSPLIISKFKGDSRVIIVLESINQGAAKSVNKAFKLATGKYICRFDGDDFWKPNFLTEMISFLENNLTLGMAYCNCSYINNLDVVTNENVITRRKKNEHIAYEFEDLINDYYITAPTLVFRKDILNNIFPIPMEYNYLDWYLSLSVSLNHPIGYLNKDLAFYRIHQNGMHVTMIANKNGEETTFKIIEHFSKLRIFNAEKIKNLKGIYYYRFAHNYFGQGLYRDARRCFKKYILTDFKHLFNIKVIRLYFSSYLDKYYLPLKSKLNIK
ncbi:glycosyltransferase family 2 protein [Pedobacter sp.]|uniref:glycosyltransferase family 2 protein n=1 Tax=Pedobacter sp. TaxID=1411316 RepID=UPI003BACCEDE